jgi:hypothetical protein
MKEMNLWNKIFIGLLLGLGLNVGSVAAHESGRIVLFDQSHGQRFLLAGAEPLGLSGLAGTLQAQGMTPKALTGGITAAALRDVGALVISGPFQPFSVTENQVVTAFVQAGGRLCLLLHISSPVAPLLRQLGLAVSLAPVRDQVNLIAGNPLNFMVTALEPQELTAGLAGFNVYGCWGLLNLDANSRVLGATSPGGWSDKNGDGTRNEAEPPMALAVLVAGNLGKGEFVVVGDDAVFQNKFLTGGNLKLAENVSRWLRGGAAD